MELIKGFHTFGKMVCNEIAKDDQSHGIKASPLLVNSNMCIHLQHYKMIRNINNYVFAILKYKVS